MNCEALTMIQPVKSEDAETEPPSNWVRNIELLASKK